MQQVSYNYIVSEKDAGNRLDKFFSQQLKNTQISRSKITKWIKSGQVLVDDLVCKRPSTLLYSGQKLELLADLNEYILEPAKGALEILYQDKDLLVINKAAGLSVHPAGSNLETTLVHRLLYAFPELKDLDELRPGIVHRLDKQTSGLMIVALNENLRQKLSNEFAERRVKKTYLALVIGVPKPDKARINAPLGRDPKNKVKMAVLPEQGREASSEYELLWSSRDKKFSLLKVRIYTGRTHQIRVHLAYLGYPLLGDQIYGALANRLIKEQFPQLNTLAPRQMLHAWQLGFTHPVKKQREFNFSQVVPRDLGALLLFLARQKQVVGLTGMPGCGKSLLLQVLNKMGVCTWSADQAVQELYQCGNHGWEILRRRFGNRFLQDEQGPVDKGKLFRAMLKSANIRNEVMREIHPLVRHHLDEFVHKNQDKQLLVAEIPLLIESGWQSCFDLILGIYCPEKLRRQWIKHGRGWDDELISNVQSWQLSEKEKLQGCQLVLENPGTRKGLEQKADKLLKVLCSIRRNKVHYFRHWLAKMNIY